MIAIRNILCPLDLSEHSATVFGYATMLARWYGSTLTALEMIWVGIPTLPAAASPIILQPEQVRAFTDELQQFVKKHAPSEVAVTPVLREGPIVAGILDEARARSADMLVLGTHGRGGFERFVLGSVAEKVLRLSHLPVLTIPAAAAPAPTSARPFTSIVCPVDFSPASLKALRYALSLAQESGKRLTLLHVFDWDADRPMPVGLGPEFASMLRRRETEAVDELRALVSPEAREWCDCRELTAIGRPYEEILRVGRETGADLIVMGVHGRSAVELSFFGSTTNQIVRHATCPVMTIRP
jgi:nucleotide-binding universal stress UspA family protein